MGLAVRFGSKSLYHLRTCDERLIRVAKLGISWGILDFAVVEGHRGRARQSEAFKARPQRSKLPWPKGKHNGFPSKAFDLAPWVDEGIPWKDSRYWYHLAGIILAASRHLSIPLRWGGDWDSDSDLSDQGFFDLGHFEIKEKKT